MTRKAPRRLWRAIVLDEDGRALSFVLYADTADDAADMAEYQTGLETVTVDDVTPGMRKRPAGLLTVAA